MDDHADEFTATDKPWADVIAASLAVQVITFSGLLLVAFSAICRNQGRAVEHMRAFLVPAFAAGALAATTVFLLIPEALLLLQAGTAVEHAEEEEDHAIESSNTTTTAVVDDHSRFLFIRRFLEEEEHAEEENTSYMWMFGVAVMAGFLLPVLISTLFPSVDLDECAACAAAQEQAMGSTLSKIDEEEQQINEDDDESTPKSHLSKQETVDLCCEEGVCEHALNQHDVVKPTTTAAVATTGQQHGVRNWSLVASISFGDALHNFTDGIFLGNAFLLCGRTVAYTMVATTIYHELAQEISDLGLLTHHCGLPLWMALALNVLAGCSTMAGALLVLSLDVTEKAMGIFLAISAGVYINIFACECMPRVQAQLKSHARTLQFILCFALGSVPIGLVLLDHGHCEEGH